MDRQIDHKKMRVVVGVIALLLSPVVYVLSGLGPDLESISASYWTHARDIFVGALVAVGFFLSAYNGAGGNRDWEYFLSRIAWIFAIGVALFPTTSSDPLDAPPQWVSSLTAALGVTSGQVHYSSAIVLFACLIAMMWFFSNRAKSKGKSGRSNFYRAVAVLMAVGIIGLIGIGKWADWGSSLFWAECWGLTLFGIGWMVAGSYKTDPSLE